MTSTTPNKDRITIEKFIKGKKGYMYRIRFNGGFFSVLAPEHMSLIKMFLDDRKAKGLLWLPLLDFSLPDKVQHVAPKFGEVVFGQMRCWRYLRKGKTNRKD